VGQSWTGPALKRNDWSSTLAKCNYIEMTGNNRQSEDAPWALVCCRRIYHGCLHETQWEGVGGAWRKGGVIARICRRSGYQAS